MVYSLCLRYGFPAIIEKCNLFDHLPGTLIDLFHLRKKLQLPIACAHLLRLIKLVSIGQYRLNTFQITSKFLVHFVIWLQFSKPLQSLLELYFTLFTIDFLPVGDSFTANPIMKSRNFKQLWPLWRRTVVHQPLDPQRPFEGPMSNIYDGLKCQPQRNTHQIEPNSTENSHAPNRMAPQNVKCTGHTHLGIQTQSVGCARLYKI